MSGLRFLQDYPILTTQLSLAVPLFFSWLMALADLKTRRIPNYLTFVCFGVGLGYQLGFYGWPGLLNGFLGVVLGFALLIFFYMRGGLGAGDVKALAALGAWLGPLQTLYLFIYTGLSGVIMIVALLYWRGILWVKMRQVWESLINWLLLRSFRSLTRFANTPTPKIGEIPYAMPMAMGMAILCWRGFAS